MKPKEKKRQEVINGNDIKYRLFSHRLFRVVPYGADSSSELESYF